MEKKQELKNLINSILKTSDASLSLALDGWSEDLLKNFYTLFQKSSDSNPKFELLNVNKPNSSDIVDENSLLLIKSIKELSKGIEDHILNALNGLSEENKKVILIELNKKKSNDNNENKILPQYKLQQAVNGPLPYYGWQDNQILLCLHQFSMMDVGHSISLLDSYTITDAKLGTVGLGEREGRVFSSLVSSRSYGLHQGIGRSGDLSEAQPKALGGSILHRIVNEMTKVSLKLSGLGLSLNKDDKLNCQVFPFATGMLCLMSLLVLKSEFNTNRNEIIERKNVLWIRIDQKSCFKAILSAGLNPIALPQKLISINDYENYVNGCNHFLSILLVDQFFASITNDLYMEFINNCIEQTILKEFYKIDEDKNQENDKDKTLLVTDIPSLIITLLSNNYQSFLCVLSTTSCFAPRQPDLVSMIAKICKFLSLPHLINNAYGLQSREITQEISRAARIGRVDGGKSNTILYIFVFIYYYIFLFFIVIQSTDKNFLVPVGGSILASFKPYAYNKNSSPKLLTNLVSQSYPGRASASSIIDLFITQLSLGQKGYLQLLSDREKNRQYFFESLKNLSEKYNLKIISSPLNTISYSLDLSSLEKSSSKSISELGSMFFQRKVTGSRVVAVKKNIISNNNLTKNNYSYILGKEISKTSDLSNWGSHHDNFPVSYLTVACSIGLRKDEIDEGFDRITKVIQQYLKK